MQSVASSRPESGPNESLSPRCARHGEARIQGYESVSNKHTTKLNAKVQHVIKSNVWVRLLPIAGVLVGTVIACSGGRDDAPPPGDVGSDSGADSPSVVNSDIDSLIITPATASLVVNDGAPAPTAVFKTQVKLKNGTVQDVSGANFGTQTPELGSIDATGTFKPSGNLGGVATIVARLGDKQAKAQASIQIVVRKNDAMLAQADQDLLRGATTADQSTQWAYPYDATVFPRGVGAPLMMWFGQGQNEPVLVSLKGPGFDYENFVLASDPARVTLDPVIWQRLSDSSSGDVSVHVARKSGGAATVLVDQKWTMAPGTMRGTIYYWANSKGRVMRIKAGATAPDDFTATTLPQTAKAANGTDVTCTMTCHAVSANGAVIASGGDVFGGTYDLLKNVPIHDLGDLPLSTQRRSWQFPALTPDGSLLVKHATAEGLFDAASGAGVAAPGLESKPHFWPAFGPDGKTFFNVDLTTGSTSDLHVMDFDEATHTFSNDRVVAAAGADVNTSLIANPAGSPDGKWVVYARGNSWDSRGTCPCDANGVCTCTYANRGTLGFAPTTPGPEAILAAAGGVGTKLAAGDRDLKWDFEPTMAPVSAGGYLWVAFTSRRTYGNLLTGARDVTKQIWITAIDENPVAGKDPSHPAFWLPGQETNTLNMRAFWVRDPCKANGTTCAASGECCGGTCEAAAGSTTATCKSATCAATGEHCEESADCCDVAKGVSCVDHLCNASSIH